MATHIVTHEDGTKLFNCTGVTTGTVGEHGYDDKMVLNSLDPRRLGDNVNFSDRPIFGWNFPSPCTIEYIKVGGYQNTTVFAIDVSDNAIQLNTPDVWTTVLDNISGWAVWPLDIKTITLPIPVSTRWLRFRKTGTVDFNYVHRCYIYGDYDTRNFEFWNIDVNGNPTTRIEGESPITFPLATNSLAYNQYKSFKIKNLTNAAHTYNVYFMRRAYIDDPAISSYCSIAKYTGGAWVKFISSDNDSGTDVACTTASVSANSFSEELRMYIDWTTAQNPANGYHHFGLKATEAS